MEKLMLWLLYFISFIIVVSVQIAYSKLKLSNRMKNIKKYSDSVTGDDVQAYGERFREDLEEEYKGEYSGWSYAVPVAFIFLIMAAGNFFLFHKYFPAIRFESSASFFDSIPTPLLLGYLGGYLFVLYSIFRRYHLNDLNPTSYYYFSIQLPLAGVLGYLVSVPLESSYDLIVSFAIGTVPVPQLMSFLRGRAEEKIGGKRPEKEAPSDLFLIQGISKSQMDRLAEEDILRVQNLAFCNPFRLYLLTNFRIKLIMDWIDQALLVIYINDEDRLNNLRSIGIRCVTELKTCREVIEKGERPGLEENLIRILGVGNRDTLSRLLADLDEDPQVKFIWEAWDVV